MCESPPRVWRGDPRFRPPLTWARPRAWLHLRMLSHPVVVSWFDRQFPHGPTPAQVDGWRAIAAGEDTLIAAPTGSGKTLAAFLVCIDQLLSRILEPETSGIQVLYVSPLRALAVDIHHNLERPLQQMQALAVERGQTLPDLKVALRTSDTPASKRAQLWKKPPQILVTTPESLYLLLTASRHPATSLWSATISRAAFCA